MIYGPYGCLKALSLEVNILFFLVICWNEWCALLQRRTNSTECNMTRWMVATIRIPVRSICLVQLLILHKRKTSVITQSCGWSVHSHNKTRCIGIRLEAGKDQIETVQIFHWPKASTQNRKRTRFDLKHSKQSFYLMFMIAHSKIRFFKTLQRFDFISKCRWNTQALLEVQLTSWYSCLPSHDDEEVQPVPGVSQVTATAKDPKSHHLYHHLQCEEDVDEGIKGLQEDRRQ